ncbi:MAG: hypothetical protein KDE35_03195 [Geminicoccaceae bacterium]|nr:hypothetical protein [Geminicoccaceae bacterium]
MIDTLRFARRIEQAGLRRDQAEAIAEGFATEARDDFASKRDLDVLYRKLVATVALMLLANLGGVWGIVASYAARGPS